MKNIFLKILTKTKTRILFLFLIIPFIHFGQVDYMEINGLKVEVYISGLENNKEGKPAIIFENGRGSNFDLWKGVITEVSKESTVFAYNRPRIGKSDDDKAPPRMKHIADNLRKLLKKMDLKPPYLLVGHSFGAAYIRSYASYYPNEVAGLIFVDPHDFTKKKGFGRLPYEEIGLSEHQIDSIFNTHKTYLNQFIENGPKRHVEEVKIQVELSETGHEECNRVPFPDIPVHFLVSGGFTLYPDETETIYNREKMYRIDSRIRMKRWIELLYPLTYGKLFYSSSSGHAIQLDDMDLVISSIKLALSDYTKIKN